MVAHRQGMTVCFSCCGTWSLTAISRMCNSGLLPMKIWIFLFHVGACKVLILFRNKFCWALPVPKIFSVIMLPHSLQVVFSGKKMYVFLWQPLKTGLAQLQSDAFGIDTTSVSALGPQRATNTRQAFRMVWVAFLLLLSYQIIMMWCTGSEITGLGCGVVCDRKLIIHLS